MSLSGKLVKHAKLWLGCHLLSIINRMLNGFSQVFCWVFIGPVTHENLDGYTLLPRKSLGLLKCLLKTDSVTVVTVPTETHYAAHARACAHVPARAYVYCDPVTWLQWLHSRKYIYIHGYTHGYNGYILGNIGTFRQGDRSSNENLQFLTLTRIRNARYANKNRPHLRISPKFLSKHAKCRGETTQ